MSQSGCQFAGSNAAAELDVLKRVRASEALLLEIDAAVSRNEAGSDAKDQSDGTLPLASRIDRLGARAAKVQALTRDLESANAELSGIRGGRVYRIALAVATAIKQPRTLLGWPGKLLRHARPKRSLVLTSQVLPMTQLPLATATGENEVQPMTEADVLQLPAAPRRPDQAASLRIAAICDPFTAQGLGPECECVFLSPDAWQQEVTSFRPHVLFVESAWTGLVGEWSGKIAGAAPELQSLVQSCKAAGIGTFFWNKEDPLHFEAFLAVARLFDHVCTTDAASIPRYKRELGHDRVHLLPFAVQPRLHHPVLQAGEVRENASFFAGAWYGRHPERCRNFVALADALALVGPLRIHDRNAGDADPMRRYPDRFLSCIRGSIDYARTPAVHRQHRIGLTVNTIKHSPTMFARRAIELMATNTSVYSNHSCALSQLFGNLLVATDDGERALELAFDEMRSPDAMRHRVRRLTALRKVLEQYAWDERLEWMAGLVWHDWAGRSTPAVAVVSRASEPRQVDRLVAMAEAQRGVAVTLWVDAPPSLTLPIGVQRIQPDALPCNPEQVLGDLLVAPWHADDLYGPDYIRDLMLARKFEQGGVIGKATYYSVAGGAHVQCNPGHEYQHVHSLALRRVLMPATQWHDSLGALLDGISGGYFSGVRLLSIDGLSYLELGAGGTLPESEEVVRLDEGTSLPDIRAFVAKMPEAPNLADAGEGRLIDGASLAAILSAGQVPTGTSATARRHRMELVSTLPSGREDAMFSGELPPEAIEREGRIELCLDARPHPGFDLYLDALDASGQCVRRDRLPAEVNLSLERCHGAAAYRFAVSVRGSFVTHLDGLWLRHRPASPLTQPGNGRVLMVVNGYPSEANLYRNAFVHRRVLGYKARGIGVDVVWVSTEERPSSYEFQGVCVVVCSPDTLLATLRFAQYCAIGVHFLDSKIWRALQDAAQHVRTVVWLHGAEIQPWQRRAFNYLTDAERDFAVAASYERMAFWRSLLANMPDPMHLVFVSRTFAEQTWTDLGMTLDATRWSVIPNPIDTELFRYEEKTEEQRYRILSIRPHASRIYANDLVAGAIVGLSRRADFAEMEFRLIGDGELFEENFSPLRAYGNVKLERRFVRQEEAAQLYREYGVVLIPTRGDTQGVSRDEAMASGMVPVTCAVGAVPEFVSEDCGRLVEAESAEALAAAIASILDDPDWFIGASRRAACRAGGSGAYEDRLSAELAALGVDYPITPEVRPM